MNLGSLNTRCRIEYPVIAAGDYGEPVTTWALLAVVWASVQDALPSRSETVREGLTVARNQTRWRARYRTDVDSSMRIIINRPPETIYQIVGGPAELGKHEGIECVLEKYSS